MASIGTGSAVHSKTLGSREQIIHPVKRPEFGTFQQAVHAEPLQGSPLVRMLTFVLGADGKEDVSPSAVAGSAAAGAVPVRPSAAAGAVPVRPSAVAGPLAGRRSPFADPSVANPASSKPLVIEDSYCAPAAARRLTDRRRAQRGSGSAGAAAHRV